MLNKIKKLHYFINTGVIKDEKTIIGKETYIGRYTDINSSIIGKFCSIGPGCKIGLNNHNLNSVTTHPFINFKSFGFVKKNYHPFDAKENSRNHLVIGNDVWIGANVIILRGVKIGDGAVIGAGAVVTKNVPAYSISVGNPAKVMRYRYSNTQISELLKIKWWDWNEEQIKLNIESFYDINSFINKFRQN